MNRYALLRSLSILPRYNVIYRITGDVWTMVYENLREDDARALMDDMNKKEALKNENTN